MIAGYGQSLRVLPVAAITLMMVMVTASVALSEESDAATTNYNRYYYEKIDLYDVSDNEKQFIRNVYNALADFDQPDNSEHLISVPTLGFDGNKCAYMSRMAREIFNLDNPGYYWVNIYDASLSIGSTFNIKLKPAEYTSITSVDPSDKTATFSSIDSIIGKWNISDSDSTVTKIEKINKGIANVLDKGQTGTSGMALRNIVSAFLSDDNKVVCAGYAAAFKYCCDKFGIDCVTVTGQCSGGPHAWNNVKVGDSWYLVDSMYNDRKDGDLYHCLLLGQSHSSDHAATLNLDDYPDPSGLFPTLSEKGYYQYTVVFRDSDGSVISSKVYERGDEIVVPASPSRSGYKFNGWSGIDHAPIYATKDVTYKATYIEDGGSISPGGCSLVITAVVLATLSVAAIPLIRHIRF